MFEHHRAEFHLCMRQPQRDTIFVEDAQILSLDARPGGQHILRLQAPKLARNAKPGCFAHLQCTHYLPLRRPMSVMRTDPHTGWVEFLFKNIGLGTELLASRSVGQTLSVMGPIGRGFDANPQRPLALLLGGGVGIPPMVFLAAQMHAAGQSYQPLVLMGSEVPFPFTTRPSQIMIAGLPADVIGCMPLMEDWGIASRLASLQGWPGCFDGYITELARSWLENLNAEARNQVALYACGPVPMLKACAVLASEFELPCQVSLEERMACATGGCAGCTVQTTSGQSRAMRRVCVDGPVFEADSIDWPALAL